jgi:hypothetical protein
MSGTCVQLMQLDEQHSKCGKWQPWGGLRDMRTATEPCRLPARASSTLVWSRRIALAPSQHKALHKSRRAPEVVDTGDEVRKETPTAAPSACTPVHFLTCAHFLLPRYYQTSLQQRIDACLDRTVSYSSHPPREPISAFTHRSESSPLACTRCHCPRCHCPRCHCPVQ